MLDVDGLDAEQVAERAMRIAAEICVYTNDNFVKEVRFSGRRSRRCRDRVVMGALELRGVYVYGLIESLLIPTLQAIDGSVKDEAAPTGV